MADTGTRTGASDSLDGEEEGIVEISLAETSRRLSPNRTK